MMARPFVSLDLVGDLAGALAELAGPSPDVARARVAVLLRSVGAEAPAEVPERW